ncbi:MAG: tetratricopeptide repeat protein [Mediterranea sp.]|jgi:tetratricopeptide (TPR) repeat protein|nr:tetratricopeptide repeat protein [Mediterranea sp.]
MKKILFILLVLSLPMVCFSQSSTGNPAKGDSLQQMEARGLSANVQATDTTKAAADSAYIKEDYAEAIQIYEALLKHGEAAEVYYNLGNSYYKSGELAKAILNYERALLMQPGNADIRANLEIARAKTVDKVEAVPDIFFVAWIKSLIDTTSADGWATWAIASFILFILSLFAYIFSKQVLVKKLGFIAGLVFIAISVCTNLFAAQQKDQLVSRSEAIVMPPSITVRSTPSESGTELFILHEGRKVSIKDNSMKGWKEISLEDGKVGWVPASSVEII